MAARVERDDPELVTLAVTVSVEVCVLLAPAVKVTEDGATLQVNVAEEGVQERFTVPAKPPVAMVVSGTVPAAPLATVMLLLEVPPVEKPGGVAAATVTESEAIAVAGVPSASATWTEKVEVPAAAGVPEMTPVEDASDSLAGRLPDVTLHV